ncbi:MAG: DEAD/DEAH box helicase [Planctomycetota bacterium]|nr:DEAD/DEAH box helicase [Planctomycetota bacterium]
MIVVHATWHAGALHLWSEDARKVGSSAPVEAGLATASDAAGETEASAHAPPKSRAFPLHPYACDPETLAAVLGLSLVEAQPHEATLRLPNAGLRPAASTRLAPLVTSAIGSTVASGAARDTGPGGPGAPGGHGDVAVDTEDADAESGVDEDDASIAAADPMITCITPTLTLAPERVVQTLDRLLEFGDQLAGVSSPVVGGAREVVIGGTIAFWGVAARVSQSLVVQQRFVPMLRQGTQGELRGSWHPWPTDEANAARVERLIRAMPAAARAGVDDLQHAPWPVLAAFMAWITEALCRDALAKEDMEEVIRERPVDGDPHVAWLGGLLGAAEKVDGSPAARQDMFRRVRMWIGGLDDRGPSAAWRLCLRLIEPVRTGLGDESGIDDGDDAQWTLALALQCVQKPTLIVDASDIWAFPGDSVTLDGQRLESPRELLLAELARAAKVYTKLNQLLEESRPESIELSTRHAYQFLREYRQLLLEQGFGADAPEWWDSPMARLGARLRLESDEKAPGGSSAGSPGATGATRIGLGALVRYRWEIAVGDLTLTLHEFENLAKRKSPLVRLNGRWVEIRPEDVQAAMRFIRENPGGEVKLGEAMRMAFGLDLRQTGIPVVGLEATGWLAAFLNSESAARALEIVEPPATFHGTLRPYQTRGVSWLSFQEELGFGVCLADDMGLGKTVQLLALLALERHRAANAEPPYSLNPTLLVVPMSVVGNWIYECRRFCPELKVLVHHGPERPQGEELIRRASESDLVITTYALAHRDRETVEKIPWGRLVLDEAQYIKNPATKQSQAVRGFQADRRIALTGTPVENRLSELWSIMDFLNPGYLGSAAGFRTRFAVPIERYHDKPKAEQLRGLIRPFILRRLKTDPLVVADLPDKVESREFCHLTSEQAALYESCVRRMLSEVEGSDGMHRRGLVLAGLIKLKQICNHPAQLLHEAPDGPEPPDPSRSGKCVRLLEMLDEVLAEGDRALVFTQFRQMGNLLWAMLRRRLGCNILFLHGGTTQTQRQALIDQFQRGEGNAPILILSLKAGGVGLNLTAATHVFHFDRWWNPAVEDQATDRAYRIGQTRTVQVHKFVVRGTLEERIDQMIEQKTELARNIIGAGERWLTELSTDQLRDLLTLRNDAVGDDEV